MSLAHLPLELYESILEHIDDDSIQSSVLSLTRAIPHAPIPLERFFERIVLGSAEQVVQLQRRLRGGTSAASSSAASASSSGGGGGGGADEARYVRELRVESWTADAQVIINLLVVLDNLTSLALFVGPNFDPDSLLEVFVRPRECLQSLCLRFRPYVQRANYYQFLKGAYFDPVISALASWPCSSLQALSIVQDPFDSRQGNHQPSFAQPLVFFTFQPLMALSTSPLSQNLHSLRVRIPGRDIGPYLAVAPYAFPALRVLDLSTGNVKANQLARLLVRFDQVRHVRLDACVLALGREEGEWAAIGKECALVGVRRARERERGLKAWRERVQMEVERNWSRDRQAGREGQNEQWDRVAFGSRAKAGRKGLATAKISLRGASLSIPIQPPPTTNTDSNSTEPDLDPSILTCKIRIAPFPPSLTTLTTTALPPLFHPPVHPALHNNNPDPDPAPHMVSREELELYAPFQKAFEEGWNAGIQQLRQTWARLRAFSSSSSVSNINVRVMYLSPGTPHDGSGLEGLEDVDEEGWDALERAEYPAPVVCFAGESSGGDGVSGRVHPEGCGHRLTELDWGHPGFLRAR